jgi:hypothetical protein
MRFMKAVFPHNPLAFACFALLIACGSTEPRSNLLVFEGIITDISTGAPIAGASVQFGDGSGFVPAIAASTTSDAQGNYSVSHDGCVPSPYLFVYAARYYFDQREVGCKVARQTINFSLTRDPQAP